MVKIRLNGKDFLLDEGSTVAGLLKRLGLSGDRVAVELNMEVVPKAEHPATVMREGDRVEVVHFVGGG